MVCLGVLSVCLRSVTDRQRLGGVPCGLPLSLSLSLSLFLSSHYRLVGLVDKASTLRAAYQGFNSRLRHGDFSRSSHTGDLKIGTSMAILSGAWRHRVSAGTGWPGASIL